MANKFTAKNKVFAASPEPPPQRVLIIMSPKAGTGLGRDQLPGLIDRLQTAGIQASATDRLADLQTFSAAAQQHPAGSDLVVAAGGDGTLSLAAANVCEKMPLVPMPFGTENLLARHFGYTARAEHVFETIRHGTSYWLDAGLANGKLFLVMATCGFDAEVVRALHLRRTGHISRLSYAKPIFRALRRYSFPTIQIETDMPEPHGKSRLDSRWAMVFNLPCYGGDLQIEPDAVGDDGRMDMIMFKEGSWFSGLRYVAGIKMGRHQRYADVVRHQAKSIRMTSHGRVPYQLDGDYAGRLPLTIQTLPGHVHLRLPVGKDEPR